MIKTYIFLFLAVSSEVAASTLAAKTDGFTKLIPSFASGSLYLAALFFFTKTLNVIPLGLSYAIWSGLGITLVTVSSVLFLKERPDLPAIIGVIFILVGAVLIQGFSKTINH